MLKRVFIIYLRLILLASVFSGCQPCENGQEFTWQTFTSRDEGNPSEQIDLYQAKVPPNWHRLDPKGSLADTMLPICEFTIGDPADKIHLTIHTFTFDAFNQRVPPQSNIQRWKRQFDELDISSIQIEPRSHGGFTGQSIQAGGLLKGQSRCMLGYCMQLAPQHWMSLQGASHPTFKSRQMAADYTIKAVGSPEAIEAYKDQIELFAESFELIEEIPPQ